MGSSCSCLSSRRNLDLYTSSSTHRPTAAEASESENSAGAIEERIERSKSHWSQLSEFELNAGEVAEVSNVHVFRSLQSHRNWGTFFRTFGKDSRIGELVMGQKFAEGGQAELYDAVIHWNEPHIQKEHLERRTKWALKVFKKGSSLRELQLQWPRGMLQNHWERTEEQCRGLLPEAGLQSDVVYGILLEDGRFAFLMVKEDEDLRHQIDRLMLTTRENCCPYSKMEVEDIMWRVAYGMEWMHSRDIIHRDLKASNVLCTEVENESRTFDVGRGFSGLLKYYEHARTTSIASLNCSPKRRMSTVMGCCVTKSSRGSFHSQTMGGRTSITCSRERGLICRNTSIDGCENC